jgi:hypothetical protein
LKNKSPLFFKNPIILLCSANSKHPQRKEISNSGIIQPFLHLGLWIGKKAEGERRPEGELGKKKPGERGPGDGNCEWPGAGPKIPGESAKFGDNGVGYWDPGGDSKG